jgi:AhpD family alkylhydroperoxidase
VSDPAPTAAPRLPLVEETDDLLARTLLDALAAEGRLLNLHRMMAHAPALMRASNDLALAFRRNAALPRALVELVILRTSQAVDCDYVWQRHVPMARAAGVTAEQIAALAHWRDSDAFSAAEKAALGFTEQAAVRVPIADAVFAALRRHFSPREIVEMAMLVGTYVSTATFIHALAVPPERK